MELLKIMLSRRSVRKYTHEPIPEEKLQMVIKAGLASESGRNIKPWELIVVRDRNTLSKLSVSRAAGAGMLSGAAAAIVVVADPAKTDVWTEDCSIVMTNMHLMADALGLGSCWIQGRLRKAPDDRMTEEVIRDLLHLPETYVLEAMLSLGIPESHPAPHTEEELPMEKVHYETY